MPPFGPIKRKNLVRYFKQYGFEGPYSGGKHQFMVKDDITIEIVELRKKAGVSQAVFASYLNVSTGLISQWERGEKQPRGPSLKLLTLVRKKGLDVIA